MGQALGLVVVHKLRQTGKGYHLIQVQPARIVPPDPVMSHSLSIPHWGGWPAEGDISGNAVVYVPLLCLPLFPAWALPGTLVISHGYSVLTTPRLLGHRETPVGSWLP